MFLPFQMHFVQDNTLNVFTIYLTNVTHPLYQELIYPMNCNTFQLRSRHAKYIIYSTLHPMHLKYI